MDGNLFNIRRLQAFTMLWLVCVLELQYADDCAQVSHTQEGLQSILKAANRAYSRMGLAVNIKKTEIECSSDPPQNLQYSLFMNPHSLSAILQIPWQLFMLGV